MQALKEGMLLYHGSYVAVEKPVLDKCSRFKDFGQGFYLTTSIVQAKRFAKLSFGKAKERGVISATARTAWVSAFQLGNITGLKHYVFQDADKEWLHCIVAHRREKYFEEMRLQMKNYDVIGGKVANDDTNATIFAYVEGIFGEIGTEGADKMCISLLIPERLKDQFCFRTQKAIGCLNYLHSEQIECEVAHE